MVANRCFSVFNEEFRGIFNERLLLEDFLFGFYYDF